MSTMRQYRKTKQVRILDELHRKLKLFAFERGYTISKVVDDLILRGLDSYKIGDPATRKKPPP